MNDTTVTLAYLKEKILHVFQERDWQQFHTPKALSMNIAIEAAELMEIFVWHKNDEEIVNAKRIQIEHEIADIAINVLNFCANNSIDISQAIEKKLALIQEKYPIEKCKGKALKYSEL